MALLLILLACAGGGAGDTQPTSPALTPEDLALAPFVQLTADGARIRFETWSGLEVPVAVDGASVEIEILEQDILYDWPAVEDPTEYEAPDLAGPRYRHTAALSGLTPGAEITWRVEGAGEGRFTAPPEAGAAFRVGFVADTMSPYRTALLAALAGYAPELLLHGGDIQYQSNPFDTWTGVLRDLAAVGAPLQTAVGNHEHEGLDEYSLWYERLLGGQGTGARGWHASDYGGVRFISLDTESEASLSDPGSEQIAWLTEQLAAVSSDPGLRYAVVYFHRPIYTLGEHEPRTDIRAVLHPLFVENGVPLVLAGHQHAYERFLVDGVTYVVDGGGGALLYDVDANVEAYPDEVAYRQVASLSRGFTALDFGADGEIEGFRIDDDGEETDRYVLTP